nr:zinc finger, CCHC-type [Tanacetum cinerariifolium]
MKIKESLNVTFDETPPPSKTSPLVDDVLDEEEAIKVTEKKNLENEIEDETLEVDEIVNIKESKNHPLENVIENLNQRNFRIRHKFITLDTPTRELLKENNHALEDMVIAMFLSPGLSHGMWRKAIISATYLLDKIPCKENKIVLMDYG